MKHVVLLSFFQLWKLEKGWWGGSAMFLGTVLRNWGGSCKISWVQNQP